MNEPTYDLRDARKAFSRVGFAMATVMVVATVTQILWILLPVLIWGSDSPVLSSTWNVWLATIVPLYMIAIPLGVLIMKKLPAEKPQPHKLSVGSLALLLPISYCFMYGGNMIGTILSNLLSGGRAQNVVESYAMDTNPLKIVVIVILAPLLEEYLCRKQILDRLARYGEKTAVCLSAAVFALMHQNLFQFFYAFGIGLVFGYVYLRTGRLRYTVILHGVINFMGAVVAPWVMSLVDLDALSAAELTVQQLKAMAPGLIVFFLYAMLLMGLSVFGLVMVIIRSRRLTWQPGQAQLPKGTGFQTAFHNPGMLVYLALCLAAMVLALR